MTSLERAYAIANLLRRASDAKTDADRTDYEGQALRLMGEQPKTRVQKRKSIQLELSILTLADTLMQQRDQLSLVLTKTHSSESEPINRLRAKAIDNLREAIADLQLGVNILKREKEAMH